MKLTGIEVSMCVRALRSMIADCDKIIVLGSDPTRPELTCAFKRAADGYRALAKKLESADEVGK